jgi:leucyl-tRNA synthetase
MLAPMAPYLTEEQWRRFGHDDSIHFAAWPTFDEALAREEEVMMVVQVNGKVRDTIPVPPDITEDEMREKALASEKIQAHLNGAQPQKIITKPPNLISLVIPKS